MGFYSNKGHIKASLGYFYFVFNYTRTREYTMRTTGPKATGSLIIGVAMAVIGSAFQFGYNIAVFNAPADEVLDFFYPCVGSENNYTYGTLDNGTWTCDPTFNTHRNLMLSAAVAIFALTGMMGAFMVGPVVNRFGRKGGLLMNNGISLAAALCLGLSKTVNSYWLLILGRAIIGIFAGLATGIVPMYISEISPKQWRGAIGVLNQLLITVGILVAQIAGLGSLLGNQESWPILFALTFLPSLMQTITYPFMPASPRFLLIDCNKPEEAKKVLRKLRGSNDVEDEMQEMLAEAEAASNTEVMSVRQILTNRANKWQLIVTLCTMFAQQLSGINAVFFYANKIFGLAGIPEGNPQDLASVCVGTVNVGRKMLMVGGFASMVVSCAILTVILNVLESKTPADLLELPWLPYMSLSCVIIYIIGFAVGPGPVPWIITTELFTQEARPAATQLSCGANWTANFVIGILFPVVISTIGPYVFLIFMAVCATITVFLWFFMPETQGKTFGEISELFARRNGVRLNDFQMGHKV